MKAASAAAALVAAGCGAWGDHLACGDQGCEFTEDEWARVKALAHVTARPAPPDPSNRYLPLADGTTGALLPDAGSTPIVQLGWHLYYETRLSGSPSAKDSTGAYAPTTRKITCGQVGLACASCHDPEHAGSDVTSVPRHVSVGAGWYDVNSQQTLNAARFSALYWNGRSDRLWTQAAQVMESPVSMNGNRMKTFVVITSEPMYQALYDAVVFGSPTPDQISTLVTRIKTAVPTLSLKTDSIKAFKDLYDSSLFTDTDRDVITRVHANAAKAIAAYELLLTSDGSDFDRFVEEGASSTALTPAAIRGLKLFVGRASCIDCHNTPMFSDSQFHNIGIGQTGDHVPTLEACSAPKDSTDCDCTAGVTSKSCFPSGAFGGIQKLVNPSASQVFHRGGEYDDLGIKTPPDPTLPDVRFQGAWRTPSLRDVAMTAPYMHDGSLATLTDVLWHYSEADGAPALGKSELAPLHLEAQDREDLIAFLRSLTGVPGWSHELGAVPWPELMHKPADQAEPVTDKDCPPAMMTPAGGMP